MAAGSTYTPIATTTLGSNQTSVTFNSFSGYTDLIAIINGKTDTNTAYISLQFNGDTGTNYSYTVLQGNGSTVISGRSSNNNEAIIANLGNPEFGTFICQIMNYANTTTNKTLLTRSSSTNAYVQATVNLWRSTSAITSMTFKMQSGYNLLSGSSITLYGIAAA